MKLTDVEKQDILQSTGEVWHEGKRIMKVANIELEDDRNFGTCTILNNYTEDKQYLVNEFMGGKDPRLEIFIHLAEPNKTINLSNVVINDIPLIIENNCFSFRYQNVLINGNI